MSRSTPFSAWVLRHGCEPTRIEVVGFDAGRNRYTTERGASYHETDLLRSEAEAIARARRGLANKKLAHQRSAEEIERYERTLSKYDTE